MAQLMNKSQGHCRHVLSASSSPGRPAARPLNTGPRLLTVAALNPSGKDDLFEELAQLPGVKVVFEPVGEEDEDEDNWDEVMAELSNPWEGVAAPDDAELTTNTNITLEPPALEVAEVQDVSGREGLASILQQHPQLVVLDVRGEEEWQAGHLAGSRHCPIRDLTGDAATQLAAQHVLVLGTGDYRGSQACVRLTRVYYAQHVYFFEPGIPGWPQDLRIPGGFAV